MVLDRNDVLVGLFAFVVPVPGHGGTVHTKLAHSRADQDAECWSIFKVRPTKWVGRVAENHSSFFLNSL